LAIIQLISDFQTGSYKIGLLHSELLQTLKDVDISHDIKLQNIIEASFILRHIQSIDNQKSIVLVNIGSTQRNIVYQNGKNWYILPDNGLISLAFDVKKDEDVYAVENSEKNETIRMILENKIKQFVKVNDYVVKKEKQPMLHDDMIVCERIFTDKWGNCYFNLTMEMFNNFFRPGSFKAKIQFVRDTSFYEIYEHYNDVNPGDSLLMFSKIGLLKLAINQGNASQLFRIKENTMIIIQKI
jgi:S-adenosylmethionine hydrolase